MSRASEELQLLAAVAVVGVAAFAAVTIVRWAPECGMVLAWLVQ
ncbi:MAG TPA: hypothetical protein VF522_13085 [Ramlibacter sp.]